MLTESKETINQYAKHHQIPTVPGNLFLNNTQPKPACNSGLQNHFTSIQNVDSGIQTEDVRFCQNQREVLPNIHLVYIPAYPLFFIPNSISYRYQSHWQNRPVSSEVQHTRQSRNLQTQTNYNFRYDNVANEGSVFSPITSASPTRNILNLNNIIRGVNYYSPHEAEEDIRIPKLLANDEMSINALTSNNPNRSQIRIQTFLKRYDIIKEIADVLFLGTADEINNFTFSGNQLQALLIILNARKCPETQVTLFKKSQKRSRKKSRSPGI
jgi:hypothetical protein